MTDSQKKELLIAMERLSSKAVSVKSEHPEIKLGETCAPRPADYVEDDPLCSKVYDEWTSLIEPERSQAQRIIDDILAGEKRPDPASLPKLNSENLWFWGGPTPYWGGTMADDTLVKGAQYYDAVNGVYVYGPTNDKMMRIHSGFRKLLCQINSHCRTEGAQEGCTDEENAERLSKLSLTYPNIVGAMCDDVSTDFLKVVLPEPFAARQRGLKKYNSSLKMYGTVYVHELKTKDYSLILPYIDTVALWFWYPEEVFEYDEVMELYRKQFPGKSILQGIFLHDYGRGDADFPANLLCYQMDKAREYMAKGIVEGCVILGDREIKKWPETALAVKRYLQNQ